MMKFGETFLLGMALFCVFSVNALTIRDSESKEIQKNIITPKSLKLEMSTAEKMLSGSCENEAAASSNEAVLKELFSQTNKRAIQLREIEKKDKLTVLNPKKALNEKVLNGTIGKAEETIEKLIVEKKRLSQNVAAKKMYSLDQRRELLSAKLTHKKFSPKVREEKSEALSAVKLAKTAEYKLKKTTLELSAWNKKLAKLKNMKLKEPSATDLAALKKEKEKELKVLSPIVAKYSELEGKSKNCYRLAIQKRLREKCLSGLNGAKGCSDILPAFEQELLKDEPNSNGVTSGALASNATPSSSAASGSLGN